MFRWLWIAAVVSQIGSFMTDVAQGWLMTTLSASPLLVALLATAESVPIFLLSLPAGAMADVVDRRRLLLTAQTSMALVSAVLVAVTAQGLGTPTILLAFAAAIGAATALNNPAWMALPAELLPREDLAAGVTLTAAGFNVARVAGPALGGVVVAAMGPAAVFAIDAASFVGVIVVLAAWRRERRPTVLPAERLAGAVKAGVRFARHSAALRTVLLHTFGFMSCACIAMALLPVLAMETGGSPLAYGLLLGSLGSGAVLGTFVLPRFRSRLSSDGLVTAGSLVFAAACAGMAFLRSLWLLSPVFAAAGVAWIAVLSTLNVSAQRASPGWVRARALAVYLLVLQAGIAAGSFVWGLVATQRDLATAFCAAGVGLVLGTFVLSRVRLADLETLDLTPTHHWPDPKVVGAPDPESGPVVVEVEYRIDPARAAEFVRAARALEPMRRRDGAVQWWLLRDTDDPARYVEIFAVETWAEHLRQHDRVSAADREIEERVQALHVGPSRPVGRHLLAAEATARMTGVGAASAVALDETQQIPL
jgi:MFS family permease/quinol monooxygenase YgiN